MIFVDLSGRAAPLADHLAPVTARLDGYDLSTIGHAGCLAFDVAANWKFACENSSRPITSSPRTQNSRASRR